MVCKATYFLFYSLKQLKISIRGDKTSLLSPIPNTICNKMTVFSFHDLLEIIKLTILIKVIEEEKRPIHAEEQKVKDFLISLLYYKRQTQEQSPILLPLHLLQNYNLHRRIYNYILIYDYLIKYFACAKNTTVKDIHFR